MTSSQPTRERVTYEQVATTCQILVDAGEKVTVRRVQAEVGGSNTTVLNHYRRWQDVQSAAEAAGPADGLLTDQVRAALATWVQTREIEAKAAAERRLAALEELYAAAKEGWDKAEERGADLKRQLATEQSGAAEAERKYTEALATAEGHAAAASKQIAELQERVALEQRNAETSRVAAAEAKFKADAAAGGVKTLGQENSELRAELRELQQTVAAAEKRAAVAEERAQNRDEMLADLRREADAQRQIHREIQASLGKSEKELSQAQRDLAVCQSERAALQQAQKPSGPQDTITTAAKRGNQEKNR